MASIDPLSDFRLLLAQPHFHRLKALTDDLRGVRDQFMPILKYYFPDSWLLTIARTLRIAKQPDFSRYTGELQALRDQAWRLVEEARTAVEVIAASSIEPRFKHFAQLAYQQIDADGGVIILMNEFTKTTDPREFGTYFAAMKQMSDNAHENLAQMQAFGTSLRQEQGT
jgi:hypothetical protein